MSAHGRSGVMMISYARHDDAALASYNPTFVCTADLDRVTREHPRSEGP